MADRTFTLDWRVRTRKNETVVRAKLGALDEKLSFRKRVRGPVRIDPASLIPSPPSSYRELEVLEQTGERYAADLEIMPEPMLRRASG